MYSPVPVYLLIYTFFRCCCSLIERPCEGDKIFATRHFQQLGVKTRSQEWRAGIPGHTAESLGLS